MGDALNMGHLTSAKCDEQVSETTGDLHAVLPTSEAAVPVPAATSSSSPLEKGFPPGSETCPPGSETRSCPPAAPRCRRKGGCEGSGSPHALQKHPSRWDDRARSKPTEQAELRA